jgi:hypothetical protein
MDRWMDVFLVWDFLHLCGTAYHINEEQKLWNWSVQSVCHSQVINWPAVDCQLWYSLLIKKWILFVKAFKLFKWEFFRYNKHKKTNILSGKTSCMKAWCVGVLNIILAGFKKSCILHVKLCIWKLLFHETLCNISAS